MNYVTKKGTNTTMTDYCSECDAELPEDICGMCESCQEAEVEANERSQDELKKPL